MGRTSIVIAAGVLLVGCSGSGELEVAPTDAPEATGDTAVQTTPPPEPEWSADAPLPPTAPGLEISPPPGTFVGTIQVELVSDDPEATVLYTVDGTRPVAGTAARYEGPLDVTESTLVRAVAVGPEGRGEAVAATYLALEPDAAAFSSDVPVVVLWSEAVAPTSKVEEYTTFTVSTFEPDATGRATWPAEATDSSRAGLRVRGSSTAGYPKRPYRLETWHADRDDDRDVALLGMPEEADWVMIAPLDFDRALMRNALMYELSNLIGRYAPRTRFAEVFVAEVGEPVGLDDYAGVYVVVERVERDKERVELTKLEPDDLAEPEITGGWLFKEDRLGFDETGFVAGRAGGALEFEQTFVYEDPAEDEVAPEQAAWLQGLLDELGVAVVQPDFTHPVTGRHYSEIIDVDSWIDNHILNVFAKNPDAFRLSAYYHQEREQKLELGPIWDFDRSLGCETDSRCESPTQWDARDQTWDTTDVLDYGFWRGLFADPAFQADYLARLDQLLQVELSPVVVGGIIDRMEGELAESAERNFDQWSSYPPRGGSFASEVQILRDYIEARHTWFTDCLTQPDPFLCT